MAKKIKKNSMYMHDYDISKIIINSAKFSKREYLVYIASLIKELINFKEKIIDIDDIPKLETFFMLQQELINFQNKLNAKTLTEWYYNVTYELEEMVKREKKEYQLNFE